MWFPSSGARREPVVRAVRVQRVWVTGVIGVGRRRGRREDDMGLCGRARGGRCARRADCGGNEPPPHRRTRGEGWTEFANDAERARSDSCEIRNDPCRKVIDRERTLQLILQPGNPKTVELSGERTLRRLRPADRHARTSVGQLMELSSVHCPARSEHASNRYRMNGFGDEAVTETFGSGAITRISHGQDQHVPAAVIRIHPGGGLAARRFGVLTMHAAVRTANANTTGLYG